MIPGVLERLMPMIPAIPTLQPWFETAQARLLTMRLWCAGCVSLRRKPRQIRPHPQGAAIGRVSKGAVTRTFSFSRQALPDVCKFVCASKTKGATEIEYGRVRRKVAQEALDIKACRS